MGACEVGGHHVGDGVYVETVLGGTVVQRVRDRDCELLEQGIEHGEARNELSGRGIAAVDFAYRALVNGTAQVYL